jgi:hypothetical protein
LSNELRIGPVIPECFYRESKDKCNMKISNILTGNVLKKVVFCAVVGVTFFWTVFTSLDRVKAENANRAVELCLDLDEVTDLCYLNSYPLEDFLKRAAAIGVSSFALKEETIGSLSASDDIIRFSNQDQLKLTILDLLPANSLVHGYTILTKLDVVHDQIIEQLEKRYGLKTESARAGKYWVIKPVFTQNLPPNYLNDNLALGFSAGKTELLKSFGFDVVLRPINSGDPGVLMDNTPANISGFMWDGMQVPGWPSRLGSTARALLKNRVKVIEIEFVQNMGQESIDRAAPGLIVQGHAISQQELLKNENPDFWLSRWNRAVRERGNRFLFVHFLEKRSIDDNLAYLRDIAKLVKTNGFSVGPALPPGYPVKAAHPLLEALALIAAVISPVLGIYYAKKLRNAALSFVTLNLLTLFGGLVIASLLYDVYFMQKIITVPGIKLAMLLPLLFSVFMIFEPRDVKKVWLMNLRFRDVALFFAGCVVLAVLLIKSGNYSMLNFSPEKGLRDVFEKLLVVRPRTKEFLIGQPLLFLGFYFRINWLIFLGMISQVSIINTFLHIHSPILISLIRTIYGFILGFFIAGFFILAKKIIDFKTQKKVN